MTVEEIVALLKKEFPEKQIILNTVDKPGEIVCEVEPVSEHPDFSVAIAYIKKSKPHKHLKTVETYDVEEGELDLYLDGVKTSFTPGQSYSVQPETVHWAEGNWVRVKVTSKPGWRMEDHLLI